MKKFRIAFIQDQTKEYNGHYMTWKKNKNEEWIEIPYEQFIKECHNPDDREEVENIS